MADQSKIQTMLDEHEIRTVRRVWAYARDLGEWETLKTCFHPDATVLISWYSGPAAGFIEGSAKRVAALGPEEHGKHLFGNFRITVNGTRAVSESDALITSRSPIDGVLFDMTSYGRFFDLFEKRDDTWRIFDWTGIYDKDRIDPVYPAKVPADFYDRMDLDDYPPQMKYQYYRTASKGRAMALGLVLGGSKEEKALRDKGARWLAGD